MKRFITNLVQSAAVRLSLGIAVSCGGLFAANLLSATPATIALTCNTASGPGADATVVVKPAATLSGNSIAVTAAVLGTGIVVKAPAAAVLTSANQSQGLAFTVNMQAGCVAAASGTTAIRFFAGGVADVAVSASATVVATASPLVAPPIVLTCVRNPGPPVSYTPGATQTITVTSAAQGGTPFTVDTSASPAWLSVAPAAGGVAGASGVVLTATAIALCGSYAAGTSNAASIHLRNPPAPDAQIPVTLQIVGTAPLSASPSAPSLSHVKGSGTPGSVDVTLTSKSAAPPSFAVDAATLPAWLSVDTSQGIVPQTLHFSTTALADSIASGSYTAAVGVQVSGYAELFLAFHLTIADPPPTLSVAEGTNRNISWTVGQPSPVAYMTLESSGAAIPYTITTGGVAPPLVAASFLKGFAYGYATPVPVTFDPSVLAAALPGAVLSGTAAIAWGIPSSTTIVTFNISVQPAPATLQAVSPLDLPAAAPGQTLTVVLSGAGFVAATDAKQRTVVGVVSGGSLMADTNIAANVLNPATIILTLTVPQAADPLLPFDPAGSGGTVMLGVCNPQGSGCTTPTGTAVLTIGVNPLIEAVTSSSAYVRAAPPALQAVAPYDMVSLFGINFCSWRGQGCQGATLYGSPDPTTLRYPTSLSPNSPGAQQLTVTFQTHGANPTPIANAPLLFAGDTQINLLVPSAVSQFVGKTVDMVVNFGSVSSAPFAVNVMASDPGIFTVGAVGQGDAAALGTDLTVIAQGNEAGMRQNAADSDTVSIFATGLGVPDSAADNTASGKGQWRADCVSPASFLKSLDQMTSGSFTTLDGTLAATAALANGRMVPCFATVIPTVTVGGRPATVTYAGWVPDSIAGAYQINVKLPGSAAGPFVTASGASIAALTGPVVLPLVITAGGRATQPGVSLWVVPRLKVIGPSNTGLRGSAGTPWSTAGSLIAASQGMPPYQYAITSGSLPAGLTLNATSGAISGTPAIGSAGTYPVTVTVTDSATAPIQGSTTFTLVIGATH